jgi:metallo-beta-lactamase class B
VALGDPIVEAGGAGDRATFGPLTFVGFGKFPAPRADRRFTDGDTIRVGPLALTAHVAAGHTPGCTSWSFPMHVDDRDLLAVDICSLTLLPFMSLGARASAKDLADPFIDRAGYLSHIDRAERQFREKLGRPH